MRKWGTALAAAGLAFGAPQAAALAPPTGWGGENPFVCSLQQAGFEAADPFGDPAADPYCVEFDKRRQNVTQLGIVDFLAKEPARVAAALPKCFYFQSDHWRASVVQDNGATKLYEWDGHYFFDKARGEGGVWVTNFNINGRTYDPSSMPGMPQEFARHMGPGTGGFMTRNALRADPRCAARADADPSSIYRAGGPFLPLPEPRPAAPSGAVSTQAAGEVRIGETRNALLARIGPALDEVRGLLRYDVEGGGRLLAGGAVDRSGDGRDAPEELISAAAASAPGYRIEGIGPGSTEAELLAQFPGAQPEGSGAWALNAAGSILALMDGSSVAALAVIDRATIDSAPELADALARIRAALS